MVEKAKIREYLEKLLPFTLVFHFYPKTCQKILIIPKNILIEVNTYFLTVCRRNPATSPGISHVSDCCRFASRQDQSNPERWLGAKCPCPTCRSKFCVRDVRLIV